MPIRDHNPSGTLPFLTILIIALNIIVFLFQYFILNFSQANAFTGQYALIPSLVNFSDPISLYPFITSMFLHAGLLHLASNMLFLWVFGDNIEAKLGRFKFLLFYLLGGILASFAQFLMMPSSDIPTIGASGAIAAVLGAYLILFPKAKVDVLIPIFVIPTIVAVPAGFMLLYWFVTQILSGLTLSSEEGGIAFFAHSGGFLAGVVLIKVLLPQRNLAN